MMKTMLLLAVAVFVSSTLVTTTPVKHTDKTLLGELVEELNKTMEAIPTETKEKIIYMKHLKMNGIDSKKREVIFCQAEKELERVSGLSGEKFDHFRTDKKLMRTLNMYNKQHVQTCKPASEDDQIPLHDFLKNLLTTVKITYCQFK